MKVAIIGAGISGMSLAHLLKSSGINYSLYEKSPVPGGIASVKTDYPVPFHQTGGHCFNSKFPEVLDFVFQNIMPKDQWNRVERKAKITFRDYEVNYPIEYNLRQIMVEEPFLFGKIIRDLLKVKISPPKVTNLLQYFEAQFGTTLTDLYFKPYNEKIWNHSLNTLSPDWVSGKLPESSLRDIFSGFLGAKEKKMPHAFFYYPNDGNNAFVKALSEGLEIFPNNHIKEIKREGHHWAIQDNLYDEVVYTGPLNYLDQFIKDFPINLTKDIKSLKYNKVTSSLWESEDQDFLWSYLPSKEILFHRAVHIGKFLKDPKANYINLEAIGSYNKEELEKAAKQISFVGDYITHHCSDHAYVVYDANYQKATTSLKEFATEQGFHLLGRFAEWDYYNMDICIKRAMELADTLRVKQKENASQ